MTAIDPRPVGLCLTYQLDKRIPAFTGGKLPMTCKRSDGWDAVAKMLDDGLSCAEISRKLGVSDSTISYRVRKIREEREWNHSK
jgi:hypothetical protein